MALTANRDLPMKYRTDPIGDSVELPVAASAVIFQGALIGLNAAGFAKPFAGVTVAAARTGGDRFVGVAAHAVTGGTGNGAKTVEVYHGVAIDHAVSGLAAADVGTPVYASDDGTLTKVALGNGFAGFVERVVESGVGTIRLPFIATGGVGPIFHRVTPAIPCLAANIATLIHETENQNGLLILWAGALVTEVFAGAGQDQGIVMLQDTDGTTLGITFTASDAGADAVNDVIPPLANSVAIGGAVGSPLVPVPAGKGVIAKVTQLTAGAGAAGGMKVMCLAIPIA